MSATWDALFAALKIEAAMRAAGHFDVSADQIKNIANAEPRLVTKFDTREHRPQRLKQITILAVKNGVYRLLAGDGYHDLLNGRPESAQVARTHATFETLTEDCQTESQVLDIAHARGILEHFFGESRIWLTGRGRRRTKPFIFDFTLANGKRHSTTVQGVQIEVDGGYEGNSIYVVEAKIGTRDNFHLRQLYYPMRMWQAEGVAKNVVPVFVYYSNREIFLYRYEYRNKNDIHAIKLAKSAVYSLDRTARNPPLATLIGGTKVQAEPDAPFPQADDLRRVIDVIESVGQGFATKAEITDRQDFAPRQASYYGDAARYLGFLDAVDATYFLTPAGRQFVAMRSGHRIRRLAEAIASKPALRALVEIVLADGSEQAMGKVFKVHRPELSGATVPRRIQTVRRWVKWLTSALP